MSTNQQLTIAQQMAFRQKCKSRDVRLRLFQLARALKTEWGFNAEPVCAREAVIVWYNQSVRFLPDGSFDIVWAEFCTSWISVKYPDDVFVRLLWIAERSPYPPCSEKYNDVGKDLVRLCAVLDLYSAPEPFYLSCRVAADVFPYEPTSMAKLLKLLTIEGVLSLVQKGVQGRASRYRFMNDRGNIDINSVKDISQAIKEVE